MASRLLRTRVRWGGGSLQQVALSSVRPNIKDDKTLSDFLRKPIEKVHRTTPRPAPAASDEPLKFFIETYGCQMNVSDSEIVRGILLQSGHTEATSLDDADIIMANTCAIRDNAEAKVWQRLHFFRSMKNKNRVSKKKPVGYPLVGVLGCMAERLKTSLLDEESVDFVCGPDAYRDVPELIAVASSTDQKAASLQLSLEETYADIAPVREVNGTSAFVSIMRDCIVPFTRGRERSRPIASILREVETLASQGVKEVVLLGQNVNSYHDTSDESKQMFPEGEYHATAGFNNMYKKRDGPGARFSDLLKAVADINPEVRIRFTSPHPKDFPDEVLTLIATTPNICKNIHLPAQSGNSRLLQAMRRGYTREAYLELVDRIRQVIPGVTLSSDFIAGFCSETQEEHADTISLMNAVKFDQAFMYAYSLREKTHAAYRLEDDVPEELKLQRLQEVIATFNANIYATCENEVGKYHLVLVEGQGQKKQHRDIMLTGRTDTNKRCMLPIAPTMTCEDANELQMLMNKTDEPAASNAENSRVPQAGDYVLVKIEKAKGKILYAHPAVAITNLSVYWQVLQRSGRIV